MRKCVEVFRQTKIFFLILIQSTLLWLNSLLSCVVIFAAEWRGEQSELFNRGVQSDLKMGYPQKIQ